MGFWDVVLPWKWGASSNEKFRDASGGPTVGEGSSMMDLHRALEGNDEPEATVTRRTIVQIELDMKKGHREVLKSLADEKHEERTLDKLAEIIALQKKSVSTLITTVKRSKADSQEAHQKRLVEIHESVEDMERFVESLAALWKEVEAEDEDWHDEIALLRSLLHNDQTLLRRSQIAWQKVLSDVARGNTSRQYPKYAKAKVRLLREVETDLEQVAARMQVKIKEVEGLIATLHTHEEQFAKEDGTNRGAVSNALELYLQDLDKIENAVNNMRSELAYLKETLVRGETVLTNLQRIGGGRITRRPRRPRRR